MGTRITNLELRGRTFYYRVSFTLNRRTFCLRLSLETGDAVAARERAARMDRALKRRWREMVASPMPMTEEDKQSVMRAAALEARRSLEQIEAGYLASAYDGPDEGLHDHLLSLKEAIARAEDPAAALDAMLAAMEMPAIGLFAADVPTDHTPASRSASAAATEARPPVGYPSGTNVPDGRQSALEGVAALSLKAAAAAFLAAHPRYDEDSTQSVWTAKTRSQFEAAIFLAHKFLGEQPVSAVDEMTLAEFVRTLRRLPANHHKTPTHAAMTLAEIAARGRGATLGIATINRHVRFVRLVLEWAWRRMPVAPRLD